MIGITAAPDGLAVATAVDFAVGFAVGAAVAGAANQTSASHMIAHLSDDVLAEIAHAVHVVIA
jgi:hypothetical protein